MRTLEFKNKYEILRENLRNDILKGKYPAGDKLPPEEKLAAFHGLNRGTVNKVLSALESEGLITRKPRIGSTVLGIEKRNPSMRLAGLMMINTGHLFGNLHTLMTRKIQKNQYYPVLLDIEPETKTETIEEKLGDYIKSFLETSPEFLAIDGMYDMPFSFLKKLPLKTTNLIFFNRCETDLKFQATYILSDYVHGGYIATKHLLQTGCKNIVFAFTSLGKKRISNSILNGAGKALAENCQKLSSENIFVTVEEGMFASLIEKFKGKNKPDAIFSTSDALARKIQAELDKFGLYAGKDYKMIGYFNTPWSIEFEPKLTSVSINEEGIAEAFGKVVSEKKFDKKEIMILPELVIRETA